MLDELEGFAFGAEGEPVEFVGAAGPLKRVLAIGVDVMELMLERVDVLREAVVADADFDLAVLFVEREFDFAFFAGRVGGADGLVDGGEGEVGEHRCVLRSEGCFGERGAEEGLGAGEEASVVG
jgi:hypothetical protein